MSYHVYLYHPDVKSSAATGAELDSFTHPEIPEEVRQRFVERLLKYDYVLEADNPNCREFIHTNQAWSVQVAVFSTEIAFSVPYWKDVKNAVFEALQTAHELSDTGELVVYDPQTGEWIE